MDDRDRMERRAPRTRPLAPQRIWRHLGVVSAVLGLRRAPLDVVGGHAYGPWQYGRHYRRYFDDRDDWNEWHRREHEHMDRSNASRSTAPSSPNQGPIT
jgi:hypothetical protein